MRCIDVFRKMGYTQDKYSAFQDGWYAALKESGTQPTDVQQRKGEIVCSLKCLSDHCTLKQGYCHNLKVVATSREGEPCIHPGF